MCNIVLYRCIMGVTWVLCGCNIGFIIYNICKLSHKIQSWKIRSYFEKKNIKSIHFPIMCLLILGLNVDICGVPSSGRKSVEFILLLIVHSKIFEPS